MIGNFAVIENDTVTNVIVVGDQNVAAFSEALGKELHTTNEIPLGIGDYRRENIWYRQVDGIETEVMKSDEAQALEILGVTV
jgi:hypothetical protein